MQIELASIESGNGEFAHTYQPGELKIADERIRLDGPTTISGSIKRNGTKLKFEGKLETRVQVDCDRCLQAIEVPVAADFSVEYTTPEQFEKLSAAELGEEDLDLSVIEGDAFDLDQLTEEQLLLALPSQVLCSPDCKGLCPECGNNLNLKSCDCQTPEIDPRWAALEELKLE
jgi:uncharacterized protein